MVEYPYLGFNPSSEKKRRKGKENVTHVPTVVKVTGFKPRMAMLANISMEEECIKSNQGTQRIKGKTGERIRYQRSFVQQSTNGLLRMLL